MVFLSVLRVWIVQLFRRKIFFILYVDNKLKINRIYVNYMNRKVVYGESRIYGENLVLSVDNQKY